MPVVGEDERLAAGELAVHVDPLREPEPGARAARRRGDRGNRERGKRREHREPGTTVTPHPVLPHDGDPTHGAYATVHTRAGRWPKRRYDRGVDGEPAIVLEGVVKVFGDEVALDGVDLAIPAGAITVLLGPSGAGKTLTINHIVGLVDPTAGTVRVLGQDLAELGDAELNALRRRMGVAMQGNQPFTCGLFFSLSVHDNVAFALRDRRPRWPRERVDAVTREHLRAMGLERFASAMPDELSSGMRKRVALARALALDPEILIVDDFDSGIDGVRLALLCELLRDAQRERGATLLVTTHDMTAARRLADHLAVIHAGRIVAAGPAPEVLATTEPAARQLISGDTEGPIRLASP